MSEATTRVDVPPVSEHALDRWDERSNPSSVAPETAWRHGQRVAPTGPFRNVDELRYHRETGTLLLSNGLSLSTVYAVDELDDRQRGAVEHALEES